MSFTPPVGAATASTRGLVKLAGDFGGTADSPTVPGLSSKANTSHTHAASEVSSGVIGTARLGSGTANSTTYLRGDGVWTTVSGSGGTSLAPPYCLVVSSDMPTAYKDAASAAGSTVFVCDGTSDEVQINAAIDLAAPLSSRNANMPSGAEQWNTVRLTGGRFNISSPILMRTGIVVEGSGWVTELRSVSNSGTGMFKLANVSDHATHVRGMWLNGNFASGGACNAIDYDMTSSGSTSLYPGINPDSYHIIEDLLITGFSGTGSRCGVKLWASGTANNRGNYLRQLQIRDTGTYGIWLNTSSDNSIDLVHIGGSGDSGIVLAGGNTRVTNAKTFYSDNYGMQITSGRCTITGFESQDDASGVLVSGAQTMIAGMTIDTASTAGLVVSSSTAYLSGVQVYLRGSGRYSTMTTGISITGGGTSAVIKASVNPSNITTSVSGTPSSASEIVVF